MSRSQKHRIARRKFLQSTVAAGSALAAPAALWPTRTNAAKKAKLAKESVVLFQGDSITDAERVRTATNPNDIAGLGRGYPCLLAGSLLADYADSQLKVFNRGISGNKVPDLAARWQEDVVALKPNVLSILIGVNDIWHKLNGKYDGTVESMKPATARS